MSLVYYLDDNPLQPDRERAVLLKNFTKSTVSDFYQYCEKASTVTRMDAIAVLTCMSEWIMNRAHAGREADFGELQEGLFFGFHLDDTYLQ